MVASSSRQPSSSSSSTSPRPTRHRPSCKQPRSPRLRLLPLLLLATPPAAGAASSGKYYPLGVCDPACTLDPPPCPGHTCGPLSPTACNRYLAPTTDPESDARPWTYCTNDFTAPCTDDRLGCPRCALRQIALHACMPAHRCWPNYAKGFVVVRTTEDTEETGPGEACFTTNHFMLVPTYPCTGVESPDPKCTGREGERYWGYAWDEAVARGFGNPSGPLSTPWGILVNPKNARSQHQIHFRFAPLKSNITNRGNAVVPRFLAREAFSTDAKHPTFTYGDRSALFASVFVPLPDPIDGKAIATRVRPFKRAARVAKAAMSLVMYGVLVTPFQQPVVANSKAGRWKPQQQTGNGNMTGVVVTAFFNVRGTVLMDETVDDLSPGNCQGPCTIWGTSAVGQVAGGGQGEGGGTMDPMSDTVLFGLFE